MPQMQKKVFKNLYLALKKPLLQSTMRVSAMFHLEAELVFLPGGVVVECLDGEPSSSSRSSFCRRRWSLISAALLCRRCSRGPVRRRPSTTTTRSFHQLNKGGGEPTNVALLALTLEKKYKYVSILYLYKCRTTFVSSIHISKIN